ncbi:MAG: 3-phosphoglycerate dehydrogenase family protein [Gammaproteobacteria bacterium]|nr:3-phosphoglycerate dehydrogenase family protein [Gammaproteobacteria bacterium]
MFKVLTLNNISVAGLDRLPRDQYEIASEIPSPDAVLVRSFKIHDWPIPDTLQAIGRAGAGVNNIPVDEMTKKGIPVFNTPGANANAVQELVLTGMLLSARNICSAWEFAKTLDGSDAEITKQVESGKKNFVGFELPGKTLGVVGLGAIGIKIANTAISLGMRVIGYDPKMTVQSAWKLSHEVEQATSIDGLLSECDFVTFHVPLIDATRNLINTERLENMRDNVTILNFSRSGIINDEAVIEALDKGKVHAYICDFPSNLLKQHPKVVTLPHLGASTAEAEDNCAIIVADQIKDYLENGNIRNAVNFPTVKMPKMKGQYRLTIAHENIPNIIGPITNAIAKVDVNIIDMLNKSLNEAAYTLIDTEAALPNTVIDEIKAIEGVLNVRCLN